MLGVKFYTSQALIHSDCQNFSSISDLSNMFIPYGVVDAFSQNVLLTGIICDWTF